MATSAPKKTRKISDEMIEKHSSLRRARNETHEAFLSRLTHAKLDSLRIGKIDNLAVCPNLVALYLADNFIQTIENLQFAQKLTTLYLQGNSITKIEGLDKCYSLRKLYLDGNMIERLENVPPCVQELGLANQRLPEGVGLSFDEETLTGLSDSLTHLSVSNSNVRTAADIGHLHRLERLEAARNPIDSIDDVAMMLRGTFFLRHLDLRGCPVTRTPKYRDNLIVFSETINDLDGKKIEPKQREFIMRMLQRKLAKKSRKPSEPSSESDEKPTIAYKPTVMKPKMAAGFRTDSGKGGHSQSKPPTFSIESKAVLPSRR